jgi:hypothetical protein
MRVAPLALAALALLPVSSARAAVISSSGSTVTYTAAPGEANKVLVSVVGSDTLQVWDSGARITSATGGCLITSSDPIAGDTARCPLPAAVVADLGDRDDSYWDWDGPSTVDAGNGNDAPIFGEGGNDVLRGGVGTDTLYGQDGDDVLDGGPGDDYLEGVPCSCEDEALTHGADTYIGGGGADSLTYEGRSENLSLSNDGIANDGAPGEGDDIGADIGGIWAGHGSDILTGNGSRNVLFGGEGDDALAGLGGDDQLGGGPGSDRLDGGDGQDILGGDDGDDVLVGGQGVDRFWGDDVGACIAYSCASGQDRIEARDGVREEISCGPGTDAVIADPIDIYDDSVFRSDQCEGTDRPAATSPPSAAPALKVLAARGERRRRIVVRASVPGAGVLRVRAFAGRKLVARATRRAAGAGNVRMTLRAEGRARRLTLRITFTGTSEVVRHVRLPAR